MKKINLNQQGEARRGFTLVELMYATVLSTVVMMAIGGLVVGYWRTAQDFIAEEQTMQEIAFLSKLFMDNARNLPSTTNIDTNTAGEIEFLVTGGPNTSIKYDSLIKGIRYDTDTSDALAGNSLLEQSVVSHMFTVITAGNIIQLDVQLYEADVNKTNTYQMFVTPRNG